MENLHSSFVDKLTIDGPKLKLDWSLRNQLIKKLNEHSQLGIQTNEPERMKAIEENNQIIAALDSLPILVEEAEQHSGKVNPDALKFLKEIDYIKHRLGMFDARSHNIVSWFKRFEFFSDLFGWSDERRVDGLVHLLDHGLERAVCNLEDGKELKYEVVKTEVIDLATNLTVKVVKSRITEHVAHVTNFLNRNKFTDMEKKYWLSCLASSHNIITKVGNFQAPDYAEWKKDLNEVIPFI